MRASSSVPTEQAFAFQAANHEYQLQWSWSKYWDKNPHASKPPTLPGLARCSPSVTDKRAHIFNAATKSEIKCSHCVTELNTSLLCAIELQPTGEGQDSRVASECDARMLIARGDSFYAMIIAPTLQIVSCIQYVSSMSLRTAAYDERTQDHVQPPTAVMRHGMSSLCCDSRSA